MNLYEFAEKIEAAVGGLSKTASNTCGGRRSSRFRVCPNRRTIWTASPHRRTGRRARVRLRRRRTERRAATCETIRLNADRGPRHSMC